MKNYVLLLLLLPWCLQGQALFTKVTDAANPAVNFTNTAAPYKGVAWIDLDDDNRPDLFVCQQFLFHNLGDGQFAQLPNVNGASGGQVAAGSSWGDIDNDGHPDCITATLSSALILNNGDNTFTPHTSALSGFTNYSAWDCAMADVDNNGRLDLLFVHANGFHTTGPFTCRLFLQQTDGTFQAVTGYEFTDQLAPYTVPVWADFDLDGDMDLFIASGPAGTPGADFCYKNMLNETGTFSFQRLKSAPFNILEDGQTYNFPDYDNDGRLDICLTNYTGAKNRLWHNVNGSYISVATPFTADLGPHLANAWGDMNNDGFLDVLVTSDASAAVLYYQNNGDGTFQQAQTAGSTGDNICGIALADYDNDGDLDFYTNGAGQGRALFRNDQLAGNNAWAAFTLQGVQSNRSAIGATIRIKSVLRGADMWQTRQVLAHNSFQSQHDIRQHFGLADAGMIDSVEVIWPSGRVDIFTQVAANHFYKIVEGQGLNQLTGIREPEIDGTLSISPNPARTGFDLTSTTPFAGTSYQIQVLDLSGRSVPVRVQQVANGWHVDCAESVPAGVYTVRLIIPTHQPVVRLLVKI